MMQHIVVTGSNRGIGLAIVKDYLQRGDVHVFATCRTPSSADELQQLQSNNPDALTIVELDVNDGTSINNAVDTVRAKTDKLDALINNAGIYPKDANSQNFGDLEAEPIANVLAVNSIAPALVTQAFVPLLKAGNNPRVVVVSSQMGSIERTGGTSGFSYRMSKAAVNMAVKVMSNALKSDGVTVITTHPGHVATDMGGSSAPVTPEQSAAGLVDLTEKLTIAQTGQFFDYTGTPMPW